MPGRHGSLVWYDSPARIRALAAMSHEALAAEVHRHFPARLGGNETVGMGWCRIATVQASVSAKAEG